MAYHLKCSPQEYAEKLQVPFFEASANNDANVKEVFMTMASEIKKFMLG